MVHISYIFLILWGSIYISFFNIFAQTKAPTVIRPTYGDQDEVIHAIMLKSQELFFQGRFDDAIKTARAIEKLSTDFKYISDYFEFVILGKVMRYYRSNQFNEKHKELFEEIIKGARKDAERNLWNASIFFHLEQRVIMLNGYHSNASGYKHTTMLRKAYLS